MLFRSVLPPVAPEVDTLEIGGVVEAPVIDGVFTDGPLAGLGVTGTVLGVVVTTPGVAGLAGLSFPPIFAQLSALFFATSSLNPWLLARSYVSCQVYFAIYLTSSTE
jgi:hypothetical protein